MANFATRKACTGKSQLINHGHPVLDQLFVRMITDWPNMWYLIWKALAYQLASTPPNLDSRILSKSGLSGRQFVPKEFRSGPMPYFLSRI